MAGLADYLQTSEEPDAAEHWLRQAIKADHRDAATHLRKLLRRQGRLEEVEEWCRRDAERGEPTAMCELAEVLEARDAVQEAEEWLRKARTCNADEQLAGLLERSGRIAE